MVLAKRRPLGRRFFLPVGDFGGACLAALPLNVKGACWYPAARDEDQSQGQRLSPTRFALAGRGTFAKRCKSTQKIWCPRPRRLRRSPSLLGRNGQSRLNSLRSDRRACSIPFRPALLRRVSRAQRAVVGPRAAGHTNRLHALRANRLLAFPCTASLGPDVGSVIAVYWVVRHTRTK